VVRGVGGSRTNSKGTEARVPAWWKTTSGGTTMLRKEERGQRKRAPVRQVLEKLVERKAKSRSLAERGGKGP